MWDPVICRYAIYEFFFNDRVLDNNAKLNPEICMGKFENLPIVTGHDIHERRDWIE